MTVERLLNQLEEEQKELDDRIQEYAYIIETHDKRKDDHDLRYWRDKYLQADNARYRIATTIRTIKERVT